MKNDIKKRYYSITFFTAGKYYGETIEKNDIKTAFYCFRDLINSGLYYKVVFRVETAYKCGVNTSDPKIVYTDKTGVNFASKKINYHYNAFKRYIACYGSSKQIIFNNI